jgi:nucleotide-binding universal stress UspA family protein
MSSITDPLGMMGSATMPVGAPNAAWKRLLVPTDFSPAADQAIRVAAGLARRSGATLTLLHVVEINGKAPLVGSARDGEFLATLWAEGAEKLQSCAESLTACGLSAIPLVVEGIPAEQILLCSVHHDLVVLARSSRRWRLFARRTWSAVMAACSRTVLLVPA